MPVVTHTRKERSADGTHDHIKGVCQQNGAYTSRADVVAGLRSYQDWRTLAADGSGAKIRIDPCRVCGLTPYITTAPDHSRTNNLDNLPAC